MSHLGDSLGEDEPIMITRVPEEDLSVREVRISCPDVCGLGVDLTRIILDFGLRILHADISTDGSWCFIILKVQLSSGVPPRWSLLKSRLQQVIPSGVDAIRSLWSCDCSPKEQPAFLLEVSGYDRQGMLHALSHVLWEADTSVFKAHITTTPGGSVHDTFWLHDNKNELPDALRVLEICDRVKGVLGSEAECTIRPDNSNQGDCSPGGSDGGGVSGRVRRMACKDAASRSNLRAFASRRRSISSDSEVLESISDVFSGEEVSVEVDNVTSSSFTLISLHCRDRKGLLYDLFKAFKDINLQVAYTKLEALSDGSCEADIFLSDADGAKITDPSQLQELIEITRSAVVLPVKVQIRDSGDGSATELTVAAGVDAGGRGRPRVTFDVTQGLSSFGVGIDTADVFVEEESEGFGKSRQPQEMHRFLIHMPDGKPLCTEAQKRAMQKVICAALMGLHCPLDTCPAAAGALGQWGGSSSGKGFMLDEFLLGDKDQEGASSSMCRGIGRHQEEESEGALLRAMSNKWKGKK